MANLLELNFNHTYDHASDNYLEKCVENVLIKSIFNNSAKNPSQGMRL